MALPSALSAGVLALQVLLAGAIQLRQDEEKNPLKRVLFERAAKIDSRSKDCTRDWNCGLLSGATQPPLRVQCEDGDKWVSANAVYVPGKQKGKGLIYCSIPKIATTFTYWVMNELNLPTQPGKRNSGYQNVGSMVYGNSTDDIEDLCSATSFIVVRNPWDRAVSAYVDKVLSNTLFQTPPSFDEFLKELAAANASMLNPHFRPASLHCSTTGEQAAHYDKVIHIEANMEKHLTDLFIGKLGLPGSQVHKAVQAGMDIGAAHSMNGNKHVDLSVDSGMDRTEFYFSKSDPGLVKQIYGDDIIFGHYAYGGLKRR